MKTKRALFSIVVFLSVYWISILVGFNKPPQPIINKGEDAITQTFESTRIDVLTNKYGNLASASNRLYLDEESDTDAQTDRNDTNTQTVQNDTNTQTDQNDTDTQTDQKNEIDGSPRYETVKESTILLEENIEEKPKDEPEATQPLYADIGISIANSYVNIRDKANTESEVKGKLYKDSAAKILDSVGDWYYIESGNVKGYVSTDYIKTGIPDDELIETYGSLSVLVNIDGLNVREKTDVESKKLTVIYQGEQYPVIDLQEEWIKIDINDEGIIGYVSKDYVELLVDFNKAVSKQEEEELIKLQEEEQKRLERKQEEERIKKETEIKYREEVDYAQDDLKLLACLVHSEASNQSYEGKLAVANVVLNRVKSGKYPDTIKDVIYQSGQFAVTKNGSLTKQLERYNNYSTKSQKLTIKAAKAALSGENNIGNRLYFNGYKAAVRAGHDKSKTAVKIEGHLFW